MQMIGKRYADYSRELRDDISGFRGLDAADADNMLCQIREVEGKTGSVEWWLIGEIFESEAFYAGWVMHQKDPEFHQQYIHQISELLVKAEKAGLPYLELLVRQIVIDYWWFDAININYEQCFELYDIQALKLSEVSSVDIPEKAKYYIHIANAYYFFKEYTKAIDYFNLALEEQDNDINLFWKRHAYNGLGLCYSVFHDFSRSDSCFYAIMEAGFSEEDDKSKNEWSGISEGNLGKNLLERGELDKAIPLLKSSIDKMLTAGDFAFAASRAINLADIYMKTDNLKEAKYYIDLAEANRIKTRYPRNNDLFYEVRSKYYIATGNEMLGASYMDSMLVVMKSGEEQSNTRLLLRIENKELAKQQQELAWEKSHGQLVQRRFFVLSCLSILIFSLLIVVYSLYRKNQAAYKELVRKSLEWAHVKSPFLETCPSAESASQNAKAKHGQNASDTMPDDIDISVMNAIERCLREEKIYTNASLTVNLLAQKINVKYRFVSLAINRCTKKSFSAFINEYRIKEAIRLLSDQDNQAFAIDHIAYCSGFNDRINFYKVFKKITGLSPSDFRKNLGATDDGVILS
jgi:AraC-like DNA-binding protein